MWLATRGLVVRNVLISGRPGIGGGGGTRGHTRAWRGICQLCPFILSPGWEIGLLLHFRSRVLGERPAGFVAPPPFCGWSWKRVPFPSAKGLGISVNTFWQKTVNDCHISLVFCSFLLAIFRLRSDYIFRKKTTIPSIELF